MTATSIVPSSSLNVCEGALQNGQAAAKLGWNAWKTTVKATAAVEMMLNRRISNLPIAKATAELLNYTASTARNRLARRLYHRRAVAAPQLGGSAAILCRSCGGR